MKTGLSAPASGTPEDRRFFGHPRGLSTLFFTEFWERWGYYGMRSLLILFMTAATTGGGLGFDVVKASAIYGLYTSMVYMVSLPGGWIADRILGQRRSVLTGGIIISAGYLMLAIPGEAVFYTGLVTVIAGTGLLKPNISTIVGQLYRQGDPRRDAGFSIFYMGINMGAFFAPIFCGLAARSYGWRSGMALAGIGMLAGVAQYLYGYRFLGEAGLHPVNASPEDYARQKTLLLKSLAAIAVLFLAAVAADAAGILHITAKGINEAGGTVLLILTVAFFGWLFTGDWDSTERKRLIVICVLFAASCLFWSVFEQAGSTLNIFAANSTDNRIFGWEYPAAWMQSLNGLFIWTLAPVFAWIWIKMGSHEPSSPTKFSWGLVFVGLGFLVLIVPAGLAAAGAKVSPLWLAATYLLHTFGELCLSPVGLSAITKLAPVRVAGLMMGVWFLSLSIGNYLGGRMAGLYTSLPLSALFGAVGGFAILAGLLLAVFARPITKLMGGVR